MSREFDGALIGGRWRRVQGRTRVENPADGSTAGWCGSGTPADVSAAVDAARRASSTWARTSPQERADCLDALIDALRARRDELVDVTVAEVGAPVSVARESHVDLALDVFASAARHARAFEFEAQLGPSLLIRKPAGVVAAITPWNYPLYQLAAKVGPALAAGCTVVLKPAELAPLSAHQFAQAVLDAGLPEGVVNLVPGSGSVVGAALAGHPGVDLVSFTGSTAVGRQVAAAAAANLARVSLELGGKSASIVCPGADLGSAVRATVDSAMLNSGQTCSAWTRLLVPRDDLQSALAIAAEHGTSLVVGDPRAEDTDLGPLISAAQRDSVRAVIDSARRRGARVVTGGTQSPRGLDEGHYLPPTVLADLPVSDPASQEEIFGPVLVVHGYDTVDQAVRIANGTAYGLSGAVFAADEQTAMDVARQLETGQVDVNGAPFNVDAPFGGWKASGIGRELGPVGLEEYTQLTSIQR
ncbi:aldehyde dehydrogenase family protein [Blastococcus sp. BMG 814]|uniref:Aldehyde dehydrogenase family protein n=1 Tax=Blastococcus carthaginiensis TaxID=3050034 RepID=A0ABT9I9W1_9ACTN|nr:aldehyde dehydrogenase family protein [Blastococcus carthaginiensis]MDP5182022.1 aldehyde dehydrogenase family protein [Blastococcus carthaginiensis]